MLDSFAAEAPAPPFELFDFGVRRRYSRDWQREVLATFQARVRPSWIKGTSNVQLAMGWARCPSAPWRHEYLQSYQSHGVPPARFPAGRAGRLGAGIPGDLGIALTDVVGMDAFLADFDLYFCQVVRRPAPRLRRPAGLGRKALAHYAKLRIDPHTKRLVFSDG